MVSLMLPSGVVLLHTAPGHAFLQLDVYGENCSSLRVEGASEGEKMPRKEDQVQERNRSWLVDSNSEKLRR